MNYIWILKSLLPITGMQYAINEPGVMDSDNPLVMFVVFLLFAYHFLLLSFLIVSPLIFSFS